MLCMLSKLCKIGENWVKNLWALSLFVTYCKYKITSKLTVSKWKIKEKKLRDSNHRIQNLVDKDITSIVFIVIICLIN